MRVFVAVDLPEALREALVDLQREIPAGRVMAPETLHLTLAFLGDRPDAAVEAVHEELATLHAPPVEVRGAGLDLVGAPEPSLLWLRVEATPALQRLASDVRRAVARAGLRLPRERFRPHVTLARFRHPDAGDLARLGRFMEARAAADLPAGRATSFSFYRSHLRPEGAQHEALATYPLG